MKKTIVLCSMLALLSACQQDPVRQQSAGVPQFKVDPFWPKPLPSNWILGQVAGLAVDRNDNIWIVHRPSSLLDDEKGAQLNPPTTKCCISAPPVLQFDAAGNLLRSWGGKGAGYDWPENEHGLSVDNDGNVWVGGNSNQDHHILKFTPDGKFVREFRIEPETLAQGSVWDLVLSEDKEQKYLFVANGANGYLITAERATGQVLGTFSRPGRMAGELRWVHNIGIDSKGNLYTAEVGFGRRAQKFSRLSSN